MKFKKTFTITVKVGVYESIGQDKIGYYSVAADHPMQAICIAIDALKIDVTDIIDVKSSLEILNPEVNNVL